MHSSHASPPDHLDTALELDPGDWSRRDVYRLMTSLVVPRPIAWISTLGADGVRNLAPHSYFMPVSSHPPHVAFASTGVKDTLANIRRTGEFVVNVVPRDLVDAMNATSIDLPAERDEFVWAELKAAPAHRVSAPRVADSPAHFECRSVDEIAVGESHLVIAEVVHVSVDPALWAGGGVDVRRLDPVARLSGGGYADLGEHFTRQRPRFDPTA